MGLIKELLNQKPRDQTVFTLSDLSLLVGYNGPKLRSALKYAVFREDLVRITKGIYALNSKYSKWEFGNKYRSPSYVSFYSVLASDGVVFQPYSSVFLASQRSQMIEVDEQKYIYRKIKDEVLLNTLGVVIKDGVACASIERAICDKLYLDGDEYFDNLRSVDWGFMEKLNREVYQNMSTINEYIGKCKS